MTAWLDDGDVRLYHGDALEQLALMPSESVQCIVTSPPFWGLRDYSCEGQIGLEETPDEWCQRLVAVMREARRVLRSDGCAWVELGDTYTSGMFTRQGKPRNVPQAPNGYADQDWTTDRAEAMSAHAFGELGDLKPKDLVGAPWLLAFALRADGWYLRSDTIWARPNPMPESVTDRPTKAHSYVFLLTKSARYFYDADAIREPHTPDGRKVTTVIGTDASHQHRNGERWPGTGRNARSVWSIPTEPTPFAHFATFPQALVERCIKAGTSEHGACSECGAPWRRITEPTAEYAGALAQRPHRNGFDQAAFAAYLKRQRESAGLSCQDVSERIVGTRSGACWNWEHHTAPTWPLYIELKGVVGLDDRFDESLRAYRFIIDGDWTNSGTLEEGKGAGKRGSQGRTASYQTLGWEPSCAHDAPVVPCLVADPFMGSGTTALVARRLNRHAIGIELNPEYLAIAAKRLQQLSLLTSSLPPR